MTLFTHNGQLLPLAQFREALANGADPNSPWLGDNADVGTKLPLLEAAQRHIHHLRHLLAHPRIRTDVVDRDGASALIVALKYNHIQAVHLLITAGVSVSQADRYGTTPLHYAVHNDGAGPLRQLLSTGANPNAKGPYGRTPLAELLMERTNQHIAIELKTRVLLSNGANPNLRDSHGRTALHAAAVSGYYHVVDALLEFGANADLRSNDGLTPLEEARSSRVTEPFLEPFKQVVNRLAKHNRDRLTQLVQSVVARGDLAFRRM
ncbi:ankyrin repeat domain-containing protein [Stenotrophomonas maltophilia]|uniref:ankyrin repeat domain-containing protein n=1 Tax=Stenotrophomonas maltophilia TaxID=40324 RepID=UPI000DA89A30|nr:ankyrin repeat domain-containing protein [Stenotrophomonas maltophilia]